MRLLERIDSMLHAHCTSIQAVHRLAQVLVEERRVILQDGIHLVAENIRYGLNGDASAE